MPKKTPPNLRRILTANGTIVTLPPSPKKEPTMIQQADELIVKTTGDMNVIEVTTQPAPLTKRCEECKRILPISRFKPHPLGKDGYGRFCNECRDKLAAKRREHATVQPIPTPQPAPNLTAQTTTRGLEITPKSRYSTETGKTTLPELVDDLRDLTDELAASHWFTLTLEALPSQQSRNTLIRLLLSL